MCSLHHCSKFCIDLSVAHVTSLKTPISTSAQAPSAPEQNFTSAQSPKNAILNGCNGNITQVALVGCSRVTRHPFHARICSRSSELDLQFDKPLHGQSRLVDSRASTLGSQTCSLLLPPGERLGPFIMGCAGVRKIMRTPTKNVSNDRSAQDCNESEPTSLKAREFATQTKSVCGRDHAPNQDTWEKFVVLSVKSQPFPKHSLLSRPRQKAGPPIKSRHMATHPTSEQGLVHLKTKLFRHADLGGFNMVVNNHHVNVKATTNCSGHGRD